MIYLVCQDWSNTSNNHAGMKYLCLQLQKKFPESYKTFVIDDYYKEFPKNLLKRQIHKYLSMRKYQKKQKELFKELSTIIQRGDRVFLMEYMERLTPQLYLAKKMKAKFPTIPVYGLVHLVPEKLEISFTQTDFEEWTSCLDKIITLGSSLSSYLVNKGIPENKIFTTFHYVDTEYYRKDKEIRIGDKVRVIAMGNQMRNVGLLKNVVYSLPEVLFTICQGVGDMTKEFEGCENVTLIPFVSEDKLKSYMDEADISLNVMKDTIGSNVIVTSMAMGLAMVCSDVGSIRDYCSEDNCIFCDNDTNAFVKAVSLLVKEKDRIYEMKLNSLEKARGLSMESFSISLI